MSEFQIGDRVFCVDNKAKAEWAEWYQDDDYAGDLLSLTTPYIVRSVAVKDGQVGLDVGVPTPWGDQHWNADRFRKALLRAPVQWDESAQVKP